MSGLSRLGQGDIEQAIAYRDDRKKFPRPCIHSEGAVPLLYLGNKESLLQIAEKFY